MKVYRLIHRLEKSDISSYITAQIAVINHPTQTIDLKSYLPKARYVYQEENGAIFHSEDGRYQALYHLYDAENDQYIVALYRALISDVDDITKMYSIFRTMGNDIPKNIFNKDDFDLSPQQFEKKHHLTLENYFINTDFIEELRIQFESYYQLCNSIHNTLHKVRW